MVQLVTLANSNRLGTGSANVSETIKGCSPSGNNALSQRVSTSKVH